MADKKPSNINALLAAQNIIHNANIKNAEKGILTSEQQMSIHRAQAARERSAQQQEWTNPYPNAYVDGGIERTAKGVLGGITRGLTGAVEGAMSLNPWESGVSNTQTAEEIEYSKKREQAEKDREDIRIYTQKLQAQGNLSKEEIARKVSEATKDYAQMDDRLQAEDFAIGKQHLRYNPLVEGATLWERLIPDANPNPEGLWENTKDLAHKMSGLAWADRSAKAALGLAKKTGPGFDTGITIDEAIQKQKDNSAKREYFDRDYVATALSNAAGGDFSAFTEGTVDKKDGNILGSTANELYEAEYIASRKQNNPSTWHELATAIGTYANDPSKIGSTIGNVAGYAVPVAGTGMMIGDVADVNFDMNQRMAEKRGTNYLDEADKARIVQATGMWAVVSKVGLDQVRGMAAGKGVGKVAVDKLFGKVGGRTAAVLRPIAGVLANGTAEGLQEVTELLTERWGTYDDATKAELAQSFVDGFVGGAGMSGVGSAAQALPKVGRFAVDLANDANRADVSATEEESFDINNKKYDPSRIINRASQTVPSGAINSIEPLQAARDTSIRARDVAVENYEKVERATAIQDEMLNTLTHIQSGQLSPDKQAEAETKFEELKAEFAETGFTQDSLAKQGPVIKAALDRADKSYADVMSKLEEKRVANNLGEFTAYSPTTGSSNNAAESTVPKIDRSILIPSSANFDPVGGITDISSKLSAVHSETDIDAVVAEVTESLTEARRELDEANVTRGEITALDREIDRVATGFNNLQKNKTRYTPEVFAEKEAASLAVTEQLVSEQEALQAKLKNIPPDAEAKYTKALKEADKLKKRAETLKTQRADAITKLENRKAKIDDEVWLGTATEAQLDSLAEIEMELEAYRTGNTNVNPTKAQKNKRIKQKELAGKNIDNKIAAYNKLTNELKEVQDAINLNISRASNSKSSAYKKQQEVLREKLVKKKAAIQAKLANYNRDGLIKEKKANREELDALKGVKRKKPVEESKAITAKKEALKEEQRKLESLKAQDADETILAMAEESVKAAEEELKVTLNAEAKTVKEGKIVEETPSLVTRIKKFLSSPAANGMSQEKKEAILVLARQLTDLAVEENATKTTESVYYDIRKGTDNFQGLETYEINIADAIANNDMKSFNRHVGSLQSFMNSHTSKAKAGQEAQAVADETGVEQVVYRLTDYGQEWGFKPLSLLGKAGLDYKMRKAGALRIGKRSAKLVNQIAMEAVLIADTLQVLKDLGKEIQNPKSPINRATIGNSDDKKKKEEDGEPIQVSDDIFNDDLIDTSNTTPTPNATGSVFEDKRGFTEQDRNTLGVFADYSATPTGFVLPVNKTSLAQTQQGRAPQPNEAQASKVNKGDTKYIAYEFDEEQGKAVKSKQTRAWKDSLEAKGMKLIDPEIKDYERIAAASNKSIAFGFGDSTVANKVDWGARFVEKFEDNNNVSTYHGRGYEATDVVAYIPDFANDSPEIARARKAELDAAIEAGATIMVPASRYTNNPKVAQAEAYLAARGYQPTVVKLPTINAADTRANMYKPTERTKETDPIQAAQNIVPPVTGPGNNNNNKPTPAQDDISLIFNDDINGMLRDESYEGQDLSDIYGQDTGIETEDDNIGIDPNGYVIDLNDAIQEAEQQADTKSVEPQQDVPIEKVPYKDNPNNSNNVLTAERDGVTFVKEIDGNTLPNAITEDQWQPTSIIPVNLEYREEAGKLSLDPKVLKQRDMPLTSEGNLYSKIFASKDTNKLIELAGLEQDNLTESQIRQLDSFNRLVNKMIVNANTALKDPTSIRGLVDNAFYKHLVTKDENGNYIVEENVVTAAALGIFQYIQTNGKNSYADEMSIRSVHGLDKYAYLSSAGKMALSKEGTHRGLVYQEIGSIAVRALGITIGENANLRLREELEASLGAFAYHLVNHRNEPNKFFYQHTMTHREQLKMVVGALSFADAKKHIIAVDEKVKGNNAIYEALSEARDKEAIFKIIDSIRGEYYDKSITLTRVAMDNEWDSKTNKSTTYYNPEVLDIIKSSEKNGREPDLLDNVFKTDSIKQAPLDNPIKEFSQETSKKTDTYVPENTADNLTNMAKQEWVIQKERADSIIKMFNDNPETLFRLMGVKPDSELEKLHPAIRDEAMMDNNIKRDLIVQQVAWLESKKDEEGNYSSFYHIPVSWVNQRVGYESTLFNAQTDLFARMLSGMKEWETAIDYKEDLFTSDPQIITNDDGTFKEVENLTITTKGLFHLALAENMEEVGKVFGDKFAAMGYDKDAKTPDKVKPEHYLPAFIEYLDTSVVVKDALKAITKIMEDKSLNQTDEDAIARAINEFGMNELSYGALFEYARYKKAETENKPFTTTIGAQSDGITNGPMITKFLMAAANSEARMMGGIITADEANQFDNFYDTKAAGKRDMYQQGGTGMETTLAAYIPEGSSLKKVLNTMDSIDGDFGSRSWAKKLLTPFNYGAGVASLKRAIGNGFLDKFLNEYYALYGMPVEERKIAVRKLNEQIAAMVDHHNSIFTHRVINENNLAEEVQKLVYLKNHNKKKDDPYINPNLPTQELVDILISNEGDWINKYKGDLAKLNVISKSRLRKPERNPVLDINKLLITNESLEEDLPVKVQSMITNLVELTYGTASTQYLENAEGEIIGARDNLNSLANRAFDNTKVLEDIYIDELVPDSQIDLVKYKIASLSNLSYEEKIHYKELSMTVAQAKAITKKLKPYKAAVASGMSNLNRNSEGKRVKSSSAGINLETSTTKTNTDPSISFLDIRTKQNPSGGTATYNYGYTYRTKKEPGVSALALIIQSIDASVTIQTLGKMVGMNMHDANMFGLKDFKEGVNTQNRAFHDSVIKYHLSQEILKAYIKPLYGLKAALEDPSISPKSKELIKAKLDGERAGAIKFLSEIDVAYDRDIRKLELAADDATIHQYGGTEGQFYLEASDYEAILEEKKNLEKSHKQEFKALMKVLATDDVRPIVNSNLDIVSTLDSATQHEVFKDIIKSNKISINDLVNYVTGISNTAGSLLTDLNALKDVSLKDVKVKTRKGPIKTPSEGVSKDVVFSRFYNTLLINEEALDTLKPSEILKEVMVASMHHNFKSLKNGSLKDKGLAKEYRAMKMLADNFTTLIDAAVESKAAGTITAAEAKMLNDVFNGRENDVEFLMSQVLYGTEAVRSALHKIPNYTGVQAQTGTNIAPDRSIFDSILMFIKGLIFGKLDTSFEDFRAGSMYQLLTGSARAITQQTIENRRSETIAGLVNESMSVGNNRAYNQEFELEYELPNGEHVVLNNYDTRFQLEMYKAKAANGGRPLTAGKVLALIESILTYGIDSSAEEGQVFVDTLQPVVSLLRKALPKGTTVTIIDSIADINRDGLTEEDMEAIESNVYNGGAMAVNIDGKVNVYMISSNASSNPNTKLSDVVHELIHVFTTTALESNEPAKKKLKELRNRLIKAMPEDANSDIRYALFGDKEAGRPDSVDEFVAQVFSKASVREFLASQEGKGRRTLKADVAFFNEIASVLDSEDKGALEEFSRLFSNFRTNLVEENYDPESEPSVVKEPADNWNERGLRIRKGLHDMGIMESSITLANQFNGFDTGPLYDSVRNQAEFVVLKAIQHAKQKVGDVGVDPNTGENVTISDNNAAFLFTIDGRDMTVQGALAEYASEFIEGNAQSLASLNVREDADVMIAVTTAIDAAITSENIKIFNSNSSTNQRVNQAEVYHPRQIANFLGKFATKDNSYLNSIIETIVDPLVDKIDPALVRGYDYEKVWHDALITGEAVYASKAIDAGFDLDDQQGYVLEVIEVGLANSIDSLTNTAIYRQLEKSYKQAKREVTVESFHEGDWDNTTQEERDIATAKYNLVFSPAVGAKDGKSDYLTNFAALAIVSPEMRRVLNFSATRDYTEQDIYEKSVSLVTRAVEFMEEQSTDTYSGDTISNRVRDLSQELARVYYKNQDKVTEAERDLLSRTENTLGLLSDKALSAAHKAGVVVANIPVFRDSPAGKVTQQVLDGKLGQFDKFANHFMDYIQPNIPLNDLRETFIELTGELDQEAHTDIMDGFFTAKAIEKARGEMIETVAKAINDSFSKANEKLSPQETKAITNTLLRPDLQALMDTMSFDDIANLIKDPKELNKAIKEAETKVLSEKHGNEYIARAKNLGNYMIRRQATDPLLAKNPLAIVERVGITEPYKEYSENAINNVSHLVSLYALRNTKREDRTAFSTILEREADNPNSINGLEYTIRSHGQMVKEAEKLFAENPYSVVKGYLPNITNPTKGFEVVAQEDVSMYEELGYKVASTLNQSNLMDIGSGRVLMTISNTGKQRYVSGALSIEDGMKSGTVVIQRGHVDFKKVHAKALAQFKKSVRGSHKDQTMTQEGGTLIPSYDTNGEVISYSYEMSSVGLDTHLERNNNHATLLGQYKGSNISKDLYPSSNKKMVDALIAKHNEANEFDRRKFVAVGPKSTNKRAREYWHSLPHETQQYIIDQNGTAEIMIRSDELNLLFGFRKFNPDAVFDKESFERNLLESVYAALFEFPFRGKAKLRHNQMLGLWLDLIKTMKDFIVIRNFKVLWGNIKSNIAFLMLNSSDPKNAIKDIKDALMSSLKYQSDMQKLNKLKHEMAIGLSTPKMVSEFAELKDAIARNPLAEFIGRGMMPMIVNDVSFKKGEVEYDTAFDMIKQKTVGKLPGKAQSAVDTLLVAPGTPLYSFLSNATQQSDFVFKYAMYQQELRKGKSKDEAIALARTVFISYDVPSNRSLQFINDIGLWMFTKFALRIQRVLMHYLKEKPGKLVGEHIISSEIMGNPSLISLNLLNSFNGTHPIRNPTGGVLTMYEHALPVQLIGSILK